MLAALALSTAFTACRHGGGGVSDAGQSDFHPSPRPKTQSSAISISNLDAEIGDARRRADKEAFERNLLPGKLVERASYLGTTGDYDDADQVSAKNIEASPDDPVVILARAHVLSTLHEFDAAMRELDAAEAHKAPAEEVAKARATIDLATGRCVEAEKLWPAVPAPIDMAARASIQQRLGHAGAADELFERARIEYRDVSPTRFAWMDFERARSFEREGDRVKARAYLEDALAAFPEYAHAAVHVATLEPPEKALAYLAVVEKRADDADVLAAHAEALRREKRDAEARVFTDKARAKYEELLRKHPDAFADHAARFFLGEGGDVKRALELARSAATKAPTEEALELWLLAARAAGSTTEACAALAAANKTTCALTGSKAQFDAAKKSCPP